jgi:hypothetical protein
MTPGEALRWHVARLDAHESGCRLRLYDWLVSEREVREAAQPFIDAMAVGCIGWPTIYCEALHVALHFRIDQALPLVRLATSVPRSTIH